MFSEIFGSENREDKILKMIKQEPTAAVILAAVHFEWTIKRVILKLGISPTKELRNKLEDVYSFEDRGNKRAEYKSIWEAEISKRFNNSALGTIVGSIGKLKSEGIHVRNNIVHGNGTIPKVKAQKAVKRFFLVTKKFRDFAEIHGENLDASLNPKRKPRKIK